MGYNYRSKYDYTKRSVDMERKYYSVYNAIMYKSQQHGDFFAAKNLLDAVNNEIIYIEKVLYRHGIIQSGELDRYCFVPGSHGIIKQPNIICFMDFYLVDKESLEIVRQVKTYPEPNIGLNDFLILCEMDYAKSHGWIDE